MRHMYIYATLGKIHQRFFSNMLLFAACLILFTPLVGCSSNSTSIPSYSTTVVVESEGNWFFDKYDFIVSIDGTELFSLSHGKTEESSLKLTAGDHTLVITSPDLQENNSVSVPIISEKDDQSFSFVITCENSKFIVVDAANVVYDSSVKASVVADPTSLIPSNTEVLPLSSGVLYSHPFILEGKYIQTVVVPTEIDETYIRAEPVSENEKFLIHWHDDFIHVPKSIQVGTPAVIIGKVSGFATAGGTMLIDSAILDTISSPEAEEHLIKTHESSTQTLHNMILDSLIGAFNDEILCEELLFVCAQTGVNIAGISDVEQIEDWAGGKKFRFMYTDLETLERSFLTIACNANSSIQSLWCGKAEVYARGYEPYAIKDYISFSEGDIADSLYILSQNALENLLKYPSSAKFSTDYTYSYDGTSEEGICLINGTVNAKNAFGMQEDIPYVVGFSVTGDSATLKYIKMNHEIYLNTLGNATIEDRKPVDIKTPADKMITSTIDSNTIRVSYNEAGDYGKLVTYDGVTSFEYHVPSGTYIITNNSNKCGVYICSNDYYKNVDGFMENEVSEWIDFSEKGEQFTATVSEGEHIELSIGADITLTPQK